MEIEICANSLESAKVAKLLKVDRVELCVNLEQGGTTPPIGLIKSVSALKNIENHVLIRCRPGNFVYSEEEIQMMCESIRWCREQNADGVVIGALLENNKLDILSIKQLVNVADGMELTFHRAIDETKDWKIALDQLVDLGFKRILTSGQAINVVQGKKTLQEIINYANNRIQIMIGGGVKENNIQNILQEIKPNAVHFSATKPYYSGEENSLFREKLLRTDAETAQNIIKKIKN